MGFNTVETWTSPPVLKFWQRHAGTCFTASEYCPKMRYVVFHPDEKPFIGKKQESCFKKSGLRFHIVGVF